MKQERKLHDYQLRIVEFLRTTDKAILSVDMGLGKTISVLTYIDELKPKSVLIVAPKRVAEETWLQEAEAWNLTDLRDKMVVVTGTPKAREKALDDSVKPYKVIGRNNLKDVANMSFDVLVLDELTSFKSPISGMSEYVRSIKAVKKIGMTGTFIANGIIDIFGQAAAVGLEKASIYRAPKGNFKMCSEFNAWRSVNFYDKLARTGLNFQKWVCHHPVDRMIEPYQDNIFTLRAEDYLKIPPISYIEHRVKLSDRERKCYLSLKSTLAVEINDRTVAVLEPAKFAKLQTLANGFIYDEFGVAERGYKSTKLEAVADFCARAVAEGEQVLLFYAFREEAVWLAEMLSNRSISFCSTSVPDFMRKWNSGDINVLISHPASAGHGLNLQHGGRIVVWSSITFNFEFWAQANARLARQGQTKPVQIHTFCAMDTAESAQFQAVRAKEIENEKFKTLTKQ